MTEKEENRNKEQMGQTEIKPHDDRFKPTESIITLNENDLKTSIKRLSSWIKLLIKNKTKQKQDPTIWCQQKTQFSFKDTHRLKVTG